MVRNFENIEVGDLVCYFPEYYNKKYQRIVIRKIKQKSGTYIYLKDHEGAWSDDGKFIIIEKFATDYHITCKNGKQADFTVKKKEL